MKQHLTLNLFQSYTETLRISGLDTDLSDFARIYDRVCFKLGTILMGLYLALVVNELARHFA